PLGAATSGNAEVAVGEGATEAATVGEAVTTARSGVAPPPPNIIQAASPPRINTPTPRPINKGTRDCGDEGFLIVGATLLGGGASGISIFLSSLPIPAFFSSLSNLVMRCFPSALASNETFSFGGVASVRKESVATFCSEVLFA